MKDAKSKCSARRLGDNSTKGPRILHAETLTMKTQSHTQSVLALLEKGKSITAIQALEKFGCFRLAARIANLRDAGIPVITRMVTINGSRVAKYSLK